MVRICSLPVLHSGLESFVTVLTVTIDELFAADAYQSLDTVCVKHRRVTYPNCGVFGCCVGKGYAIESDASRGLGRTTG